MLGWATGGDRINAADGMVAGALLVLAQAELLLGEAPGSELTAHVLWVGVAGAALVRRTQPLIFAAVAIAFLVVRFRYGLTPPAGAASAIVTPLALFGVGAYGREAGRSAVLAGLATAAAMVASLIVAQAGYGPLAGAPAAEWVAQFSIYVAAAIGGIALRDRSEALGQARARAAAIPGEREAVSDALNRERGRIARELHGVVAGCVHRIGEAASRGLAEASSVPGLGGGLFEEIGRESRSALAEMRRLLSILRPEWGNGAARTDAPAAHESLQELERRVSQTDAGAAVPPSTRTLRRLRRQGLPLLVLAVGLPEAILAAGADPAVYGSASAAVRLAGVGALALAFVPRRRLALVSVVAAALVLTVRVAVLDDGISLNLPLYLTAFVAGAYTPTIAQAVAGAAVVVATTFTIPPLVDLAPAPSAYVFIVVTVLAAWAIGVGARRRTAEAGELDRLSEAEEDDRRRTVERAVAAQRQEVARELHDLVGHGLTAITLAAAGGRRLLDDRPEDAPHALESIAETVGVVERELAVLLAALDGGAESRPPSFGELERLCRISETPMRPVRLEIRGDLGALPVGLGAAAYRIVQEALQNASKHGGNGEIEVRAEIIAGELTIEVSNRVGSGQGRGGSGVGLLGMRERVAVYGGDVSYGPEGGRWLVRARLPVESLAASGEPPTSTTPVS